MTRGSGLIPLHPEHRFKDGHALVAWHLKVGRHRFGGAKAIDYGAVSAGRDPWKQAEGHALFAFTSRCLGALPADVLPNLRMTRLRLVEVSYGEGVSDLRIGERVGASETTVRRERNRAVATVEAKARVLNHVAFAELRRSLVPEDA